MFGNEFRQPVAADLAPEGRLCEWCGKVAVEQLTVIGGKHHNTEGFFCETCGEEFIRTVAESLQQEIREEQPV